MSRPVEWLRWINWAIGQRGWFLLGALGLFLFAWWRHFILRRFDIGRLRPPSILVSDEDRREALMAANALQEVGAKMGVVPASDGTGSDLSSTASGLAEAAGLGLLGQIVQQLSRGVEYSASCSLVRCQQSGAQGRAAPVGLFVSFAGPQAPDPATYRRWQSAYLLPASDYEQAGALAAAALAASSSQRRGSEVDKLALEYQALGTLWAARLEHRP